MWCAGSPYQPLALGFDAEMGAGFLEGDFDLPAADEPGEDIARTGVKIGCQKGLGLELPCGIANQEPADRHGRHAAAIPQCGAAGDLDEAIGLAVPETDAMALPGDFAIFENGGELFSGACLWLAAGRGLCAFAAGSRTDCIEPQAGNDADMGADGGEKFDCRERAVGDQHDGAIGEAAMDLQGSLAGPIEQCLGRSRFAASKRLEGASSVRKGNAMMRPAQGTRTSSIAESHAGRWP